MVDASLSMATGLIPGCFSNYIEPHSLVGIVGVEPTRISPMVFETIAYTSSAISPFLILFSAISYNLSSLLTAYLVLENMSVRPDLYLLTV